MIRAILVLTIIFSFSAARAELAIKQNDKGEVVSISSLYDNPEGCQRFDDRGVIVKREFRDDAVVLSGIVLERADGTRSFINVITIPERFNMATKGNLIQGLQVFSRIGRTVSLGLYACGAAGRSFFLDSIK